MIIAFPHRPQKHGGPGSFQLRFESYLKQQGWEIAYAGDKVIPDVIIVVGGTRKLGWLLLNKMRGIPIVYRLDGINWLHKKLPVSISKWMLNETRNFLFQFIRTFCATYIIYQSQFVKEWWQQKGWPAHSNSAVIHNGVDLHEFSPSDDKNQDISLLCLEGNIDYSPYAIELLNELQNKLIEHSKYFSLVLYGGFQDENNLEKLHNSIDYRGKISRDNLPSAYKNSVYLSLDVNAACPNTVIEALASGIPVIGYDTGALKELVSKQAGEIVPYGSDPWRLDFPEVDNLIAAALKVLNEWESYSKHARKSAVKNFNMKDIADKYIRVIEQELNPA